MSRFNPSNTVLSLKRGKGMQIQWPNVKDASDFTFCINVALLGYATICRVVFMNNLFAHGLGSHGLSMSEFGLRRGFRLDPTEKTQAPFRYFQNLQASDSSSCGTRGAYALRRPPQAQARRASRRVTRPDPGAPCGARRPTASRREKPRSVKFEYRCKLPSFINYVFRISSFSLFLPHLFLFID